VDAPSVSGRAERLALQSAYGALSNWRRALLSSLAVGLSIVGAQRQRQLEHALRTGGRAPLRFRTVALFTIGGVALALVTVALVIAQT
jgi:hypothetical protein